jgi:short-subunit dehydrogenase
MAPGWVVITGASSGIGAEFARRFAEDGHPLVLIARRENRLHALAETLPVETRVLVQDLAVKDGPEHVEHFLNVQNIDPEIVVNSAGFGKLDDFLALDFELQLDMIRLNVVTTMELTYRLLPAMVKRGSGGIINVASLAGLQAGPYMAVYYATKSFVLHLTEAVREEVAGSGVTVTAFAPGPVITEFGDIAGTSASPLFRFGSMSVEAAVAAGYRGFRKGRAVVLPGFLPKVVNLLVRVSPRWLTRKVVKRLQTPATRA